MFFIFIFYFVCIVVLYAEYALYQNRYYLYKVKHKVWKD